MNIENTPVGVTVTWKPVDSFLPVDREFPWATPDDIAFLLSALNFRNQKSGGFGPLVTPELKEARDNQARWHGDMMRLRLIDGLGWWARVLPSRVVDRIADRLANYAFETESQAMLERSALYEQTHRLNARMGGVARIQDHQGRIRRAAAGPSYGPMIHCGAGCDKAILLEHLVSPPEGWTVSEEKVPFCPEHSEAPASDVTTSPKVVVVR
ncbi:hypothetical protein ACH4S8_37850 [Streptomyces sp. NPDC021080]|uniref:hypothetical protein n=1 Tax=Streptomyces sp. NPDC021080 TaxID=3365110 RepID=UPI003790A04F